MSTRELENRQIEGMSLLKFRLDGDEFRVRQSAIVGYRRPRNGIGTVLYLSSRPEPFEIEDSFERVHRFVTGEEAK